MDAGALYQGKISGGKASLNLGMGILGLTEAAPLSIMYFGLDSFYPGGIEGVVKDINDTGSDINYQTMQGINAFNNWAPH